MTEAPPVTLIAIVGGSGAGKGWLIGKLRRLLGDCAGHLQLDDFYRDRSHLPPHRRARLNFDVPRAIDWDAAEQALRACRAGGAPEREPAVTEIVICADGIGWAEDTGYRA